jgi:hypothetical protein
VSEQEQDTATAQDETPDGGGESAGGDTYDAPNQQVVRADGSAPWEEGTGGQAVPKKRRGRPPKSETSTSEG